MHDTTERLDELEKAIAERDAQVAERDAQNALLTIEVKRLTELVEELKRRLGQNSSNSSKPPSSDTLKDRNKRKQDRKNRDGKRRKRGGQKGHKGNRRALLPEAEVDEVIHMYPEQCEGCWEPLPQIEDRFAKRHQVTELPPVKPHTTEYRRHKVLCACGHRTRAKDTGVPKSAFGPRLSSVLALLTGVYHLSRRQAQRVSADLFGVRISLGALSKNEERVSKAIAPALGELWASALNAKVKHTDGTGWKQSGASMQLWTIATMAVTVFKIVSHGSKVVLARMFGKPKGIMTSDRAKALTFWAMKWRQICWAHLARRFISFSERDGPAGTLGQELVDCTSIMFSYWHDYKDGTLSREQFLKWLAPLMAQVEATLERAVAADIKGLSGACADILEHRLALWTFVSHKGVEPTNNHAEQELRAFVLWRRKSFGTQSERGNLFAERIMSIAHTARKQNKNVLAFLTACSETLPGAETPSLLDARN